MEETTAALAVGAVSGVVLFVLDALLHLVPLNFLYVAPLLFVETTAILIGVSLLTPADGPEKTHGLVWTPAVFRAETLALRARPLWSNYRVLGAALLFLPSRPSVGPDHPSDSSRAIVAVEAHARPGPARTGTFHDRSPRPEPSAHILPDRPAARSAQGTAPYDGS